ncbi:TonB-dependent receptor [Fulvivirgaceae bacterium BMA10]|uniref:TonB-dependent receptor n=1 Tax=Splendidivirga corallicola TaxID=3051826 RepID=A0ABT8KR95_9BACT|nr:TonB-dependent receptor [Fulvivirgaceae bacterium BMA10]
MSKYAIFGIFLQCIFYSFVLAGNSTAQKISVHDIHIIIELNNVSIESALKKIEMLTDFEFVYKKNSIDPEKRLNVEKTKISIGDMLRDISRESGLQFKRVNETIFVRAREINEEALIEQDIHNLSEDDKDISGKVTDDNGEELPGVNVLVKGTNVGTITDSNGNYKLIVPDGATTLVFSYVGYISEEIEIGDRSTIDINLTPDISTLSEVVVIGYGTQKKVNLTGAVGTVSSEEIQARPVTNVQELLQGKTPGLNITNGSGAPGSGANINIRGTSTIGGSSGVLVIIDGVPGNIYTLNPNDIESVSVLKDAASSAIYGSRAANGVLLITTKEGNKDKGLQVSWTANIGIQNPLHFIDYVGAEDFMTLFNQARVNEGASPEYTDQDFANVRNGTIPDHIWYEEIFEKNQVISTNHLSLSGNTDKFRYNFSTSYDTQSGTLQKNDYKRFVIRPDLTFNVTDWLSFRANVQYTQTKINEPQSGFGGLDAARRIAPIIPIYNEDGTHFGPGGVPGGNPIAVIEQGGLNTDLFKEALAIFTANITPLENWNIRPMYSVRTSELYEDNFQKPIRLNNTDGTLYSQDPLSNLTLYNGFRNFQSTILQLTTDYSITLHEAHNFNFLAGYSQEKNEDRSFWASRKEPGFENIYVLDIGAGIKDNGGTAGHDAIRSLFGRVAYNYDGKYLFEANVRSDGSSRFSEGFRTGVFPSFSAGWNIYKESFFANSIPFISNLKLRASWGILGDAAKVGRYETRNILSYSPKAYAFNGVIVPGAFSNSSFDPEITWEKAIMTNIGLDLGLFEDKLNFTFEYFTNKRQDILFNDPNVPFEYGLGAPIINGLELVNRGVEGLVSFRHKFANDLEFGADFNAAYSANEVTDLKDGPDFFLEGNGGRLYTELGSRYRAFYGLEALGLFQSTEDVDGHAFQANVQPGNIKYRDQNDDGVIDGDDRVVLNDKFPVRYGFNLNLGYKGFDLTANFYGVTNNVRYIQSYEGWAFFLANNARPMHLDSWTEDNPGASFPRITTSTIANDTEVSSFWLRKANYFKIQGIQLGYNLPLDLIQRIKIDYARVYLSGQNLALWTNYDGFDPEGGHYPLPRTFTLGLQLKF